ncbi:hypothetical protein NUW58_g8436 [Xylaria curta]|uniref:Uncharacterized protein n=1 Tax=Xylaria curta TaxID=42375 RepID=A0ACC1N830_9PEZI|nr:hypothetical protein NUW58_g8436 [Xylaria curta]
MWAYGTKKPYSAVTVTIERLTSETFDEDDLSGIPDLVEVIKLQASGPAEAARALRKKLKYGNVHRQIRALVLLDGLIQNAGPRFQRTFVDEPLLERLRVCGTSDLSDPDVRKKCSELFRGWAAEYQNTPGLERVARLYKELPRRKQVVTQDKSKVLRETEQDPFRDSEDEAEQHKSSPPPQTSQASSSRPPVPYPQPSQTVQSYSHTRSTSGSGTLFSSSPKDKKKKKDKGKTKSRPFKLEAEKDSMKAAIAESSIAATNLNNALQSINREKERISENAIAVERFEICKKLRRKILRYIHYVEDEQWLGGLLHANDELVVALMTFEQLDRSIDADSDSEDELAEQAHLYRMAAEKHKQSTSPTDPASPSSPVADMAGLNLNPTTSPRRSAPPRPSAQSKPLAPLRPVSPPRRRDETDDDSAEEDENDPFADRNAVETPMAMVRQITSDAQRISDLELDLEDQKKSRADYQQRARELEVEIQRWTSRLNSGAFVVVLIDGDGAKFRDEFLRDHEQGAVKAAWKLKEAVKQQAGVGHDMPILVRVYANLNDLARSLRMSGVIDVDESLRIFAEQFTNTHADCDFINVGKGKENADSKIRRLLDHYYKNAQCQMIFIACCHDNGYLHDLRQYAGAAGCKISLIETTPAEPMFKSLEFPVLRFDSVFRSEPLNNETKRIPQLFPFRSRSPTQLGPGPIARPIQAALFASESISPELQDQRRPTPSTSSIAESPVQNALTLTTPSSERFQPISSPLDKSPALSQARTSNVISSGNGGTSISYATAGGSAEHQNVTVKIAKPKKQPKYAFYNDEKYRLDPPTQHPPRTPAQASYQNKFQSIKPLVFCNDHYLKGRCKRGMNCDKEHEVELTPAEVAIHRYKARTSLCPQGPLCTDYDCYLSHHCPRSPCTRSDLCPFYHTSIWGDLHYTKEQMQPATKWTEGVDFPEHLHPIY